MVPRFSLPPNFYIRRAQIKDKWEIKRILWTWNDSRTTLPIINLNILILIIIFTILLYFNLFLFLSFLLLYLAYESQSRKYTNFWVISHRGYVVGCAELRVYQKYSLLFNLCLKTGYRQRKLGSYLVEYLIYQATKPLYLSCYRELIPFYSRFGFVAVSPTSLSTDLQAVLGVSPHTAIIPMQLI
jgi:N-acetylglutamate synthase-like GNAT family acetyltransferase